MRLLAVKNIHRVPMLAEIKIENEKHPRMIHKGAVFEIGTGDDLKKLPREDREIAASLIASRAAVVHTPEVEAQIAAELASEASRELTAAKLDADANSRSLVDQFVAALRALAPKAK